MKPLCRGLAVSAIFWFMITTICWSEVVELRTGEKLECVVKTLSDTELVVEVAGQPLSIPRENVKAIYLIAPSLDTGCESFSEALHSLRALQSATKGGIAYRDYTPRVTDAKIVVDDALRSAPNGAPKEALGKALEFYVYASTAWNARIVRNGYEALAADPLYGECPQVQSAANTLTRGSKEPVGIGIAVSMLGVAAIWECAESAISEAEQQMKEKGCL